ncbi:hypothetical protein [Streptomyces incarnatus]|nr:hypothetical protein [Streptomyces incarnatus]
MRRVVFGTDVWEYDLTLLLDEGMLGEGVARGGHDGQQLAQAGDLDDPEHGRGDGGQGETPACFTGLCHSRTRAFNPEESQKPTPDRFSDGSRTR